MKLACLFSGGKDSVFACYKAMEKNEVVCLLSVVSENKDSFMFHTPNIELTTLQAKAIDLPLIMETTKGEKEIELEDLKMLIQRAKEEYKIEGVVTGAIASNYQKERIQKICDELNLKCLNPLWKKDQLEYLKEVVKAEFKVIITGVFAEPFDEKWLGKEINEEVVKKLEELAKKHKINPAGEGGEIETFVVNGPIFKKALEIISAEIKYSNYRGIYEIKEAKLAEKEL